MKRLLTSLVLGCSLLLSGPASSQVPPDGSLVACIASNEDVASQKVLRLLCTDAELRVVDAKLVTYILEAHPKIKEHMKERFVAAAAEWLELRDQCKDVACLKKFYLLTVPQWFEFIEKLQKEEGV